MHESVLEKTKEALTQGPVVNYENLITASGTAPLEFTIQVLKSFRCF
ncbi:hypothetical protein L0P85_12850 [Terrisporobacter glycolicus]|nr:hypothetical protein L0P85_12850 [Terrisporobacter glycolicus]